MVFTTSCSNREKSESESSDSLSTDVTNVEDSTHQYKTYKGWSELYELTESGEWDKSNPYIETAFLTDDDVWEEIVIMFYKDDVVMHCESFPNSIMMFDVTDKNDNLTIIPCEDNGSDNNILVTKDLAGFETLVSLKENGEDFILRVKGKDDDNRECVKEYKIKGHFAASGLRDAIKKHLGR